MTDLETMYKQHMVDAERIACIEGLLITQKDYILETAAATAWNSYMDTCAVKGINPSTCYEWCVAEKIRKLKG